MIELNEIRQFLDEKYIQYNSKGFIENDPVFVPHQFDKKDDIEIAGFFSAIFAWGQRKTIISKSMELMRIMDYSPADFIVNATPDEYKFFKNFVHRTFNYEDCIYFIKSLKNIYTKYKGIGNLIEKLYLTRKSVKETLIDFRRIFLSDNDTSRSVKHIADISRNASGKRLNMFLRWMVRSEGPVDFGLWKNIPASSLYIPLDIHTGNISRKLGLICRKQNDWRTVEELTASLREFDCNDPVKYDFALFGLGACENF